MEPLADGTYDVIVVDAHEDDDGVAYLDLAMTSGARKGDVVQLTARRLERETMSLLGLPATLHVEHGAPRLAF